MKKCKSCKSEIDAKASKCPHCQADQRGWLKRHPILTVVLVLIVLGMIGAASGCSKTSTTSNSGSTTQTEAKSEQPTAQPSPILVDATALIAEYDKNKLAAQDKYNGKVVQTTAFIDNISQDIAGSYYLSLNPNNDQYYLGTHMQCFFKDKSVLTSLAKGQSVTVNGTMQNMTLGIVEMQDCNLVK